MKLSDARQERRAQMSEADEREYREAYDQTELALQLAQIVYDTRTAAGLTQTELARRMGTHQSVIARMENAGAIPSLTTLDRLARAVGKHLEVGLVSA